MTKAHRAGPLFADLYELTMAASYFAHQVFSTATFSLFIRENYLKETFLLQPGSRMFLTNWRHFAFPSKT